MKSIETIELPRGRGLHLGYLTSGRWSVWFFVHDEGQDVTVEASSNDGCVTKVRGATIDEAEELLRVESPLAWCRYATVLRERGYHPATLGDVETRAA